MAEIPILHQNPKFRLPRTFFCWLNFWAQNWWKKTHFRACRQCCYHRFKFIIFHLLLCLKFAQNPLQKKIWHVVHIDEGKKSTTIENCEFSLGSWSFCPVQVMQEFYNFSLFFNIFHIYFVLFIWFHDYLQLRYLFLCTTKIEREHKFPFLSVSIESIYRQRMNLNLCLLQSIAQAQLSREELRMSSVVVPLMSGYCASLRDVHLW